MIDVEANDSSLTVKIDDDSWRNFNGFSAFPLGQIDIKRIGF